MKQYPSLPRRGRRLPKGPQTCRGHSPGLDRSLPDPGNREERGGFVAWILKIWGRGDAVGQGREEEPAGMVAQWGRCGYL